MKTEMVVDAEMTVVVGETVIAGETTNAEETMNAKMIADVKKNIVRIKCRRCHSKEEMTAQVIAVKCSPMCNLQEKNRIL